MQLTTVSFATAPGETETATPLDTFVLRGFTFATIRLDGVLRMVLVNPAHMTSHDPALSILVPDVEKCQEHLIFIQHMHDLARKRWVGWIGTENLEKCQTLQAEVFDNYTSRCWEMMACIEANRQLFTWEE